ncbi:hypothetical protein [Alkaliphilus sp. B6464]|nr:hypothetical protein [Alkaliphilus sp. B6464]
MNSKVIEEMGLREINTGIATGKTKNWVKENISLGLVITLI